MSQQHIDDYIRGSVDLEPEDVTPAETTATYDMIKQYVLQRFGVKVSVLYIAQTKRKYGLDMRKNYNKSKKPGAKVPTCPPKKEKMIVEALRHFQMIPE